MAIERKPVLLRLPLDLAEWVEKSAAAAGISVNAWATMLLADRKRETER